MQAVPIAGSYRLAGLPNLHQTCVHYLIITLPLPWLLSLSGGFGYLAFELFVFHQQAFQQHTDGTLWGGCGIVFSEGRHFYVSNRQTGSECYGFVSGWLNQQFSARTALWISTMTPPCLIWSWCGWVFIHFFLLVTSNDAIQLHSVLVITAHLAGWCWVRPRALTRKSGMRRSVRASNSKRPCCSISSDEDRVWRCHIML